MDPGLTDVIAVFDLGRSWKRFLLFDRNLQPIYTEEKIIIEAATGDGQTNDEISSIEAWVKSCLNSAGHGDTRRIRAVSIAAADESLRRLEQSVNEMLLNSSGDELPSGCHIIDNTYASLIPYLRGSDKPFILVSTGTWCTFMNPFETEIPGGGVAGETVPSGITSSGRKIRSSLFALGEIHDRNIILLDDHFGVTGELYKTIKIKHKKISRIQTARRGRVFFRHGIPDGMADTSADLSHFLTYADAYHQMMYDLVDECLEAYRMVSSGDESTEIVYVTGGFARNDTFVRTLAARIPEKRVYASTIEYATALGAAIEVYAEAFGTELPPLWLGLKAIMLRDE